MRDWVKEFEQAGAIWLHDGRTERPHALLTSGAHSDGFVNCSLITQRPALLKEILWGPEGLTSRLPGGGVDWVIGSAMGAVTFAYAVAERLQASAGFTEKEGEGMRLARFTLPPGARVLIVEDTISTGGSTLKTIEAVERSSKVEILPCVVCLVNRSGLQALGPREIRALIEPQIRTWAAEECPLCRAGSQAVRPKGNWKELTGRGT